MITVIAALLPSAAAAVIFFGVEQLIVLFTAIIFAALSESLVRLIRKQNNSIWEGSGILTGLLLGLTLPPGFSVTGTAIGAVVAVIIGKEVFGGLGNNIFNPALVGRAFLQAAFPTQMTSWTTPNLASDSITQATPLAFFKYGHQTFGDLNSLFAGNINGSLGETSAIAILIGGLFLLFAGVINWRIPFSILASAFLFSGVLFFVNPSGYLPPINHILSGGLLFGAFFMATDWVTSPITGKGMLVYGTGIGLLVITIRTWGGPPEGVMYVILLMNAVTPLINRFTRPRFFGDKK